MRRSNRKLPARHRAPCTARCAALAAILAHLAPAAALAQLSVSPRAIDFGEHGHEARRKAELTLENRGSEPLTISEIHPTCGCIEVRPPALAEAIPAGGSVRLTVTMSGGRAMGVLEKAIEIRPRAGAPLRVPVTMKVLHEFRMEPRELRFDGVVGGEPITAEVRVERSGGKPFELEPVAVRSRGGADPSAHFRLAAKEAGKGRILEVTLLPTHPEGRIWCDLEARVAGKRLVVPIAGEMFRGIKTVPLFFNFIRIVPSVPASHVEESVLTSTDGLPFEILEAAPTFQARPGQDVEIVLEPRASEDRTRWTLGARLVPAAGRESLPSDGRISGTVRVRTDHPDKEEILLRFFGFFAPAKR